MAKPKSPIPLTRRSFSFPAERVDEMSVAVRKYINTVKADLRDGTNNAEQETVVTESRKVWLRFAVAPEVAPYARRYINAELKKFKPKDGHRALLYYVPSEKAEAVDKEIKRLIAKA